MIPFCPSLTPPPPTYNLGMGWNCFSPSFKWYINFPCQVKKSFPLYAFLMCFDPLVRLNSIASHFVFVKHISWFQMSAYSCPEKFLEAWHTWSPGITQPPTSAFYFFSQLPLNQNNQSARAAYLEVMCAELLCYMPSKQRNHPQRNSWNGPNVWCFITLFCISNS